MERITKFRAVFLVTLVGLVLSFFCIKLYLMQNTQQAGAASNVTTYTTRTRVRGTRGDILDTNGNVLVTNRASYDLVFNHYVILNSGNPNHRLLELGEQFLGLFKKQYLSSKNRQAMPFLRSPVNLLSDFVQKFQTDPMTSTVICHRNLKNLFTTCGNCGIISKGYADETAYTEQSQSPVYGSKSRDLTRSFTCRVLRFGKLYIER